MNSNRTVEGIPHLVQIFVRSRGFPHSPSTSQHFSSVLIRALIRIPRRIMSLTQLSAVIALQALLSTTLLYRNFTALVRGRENLTKMREEQAGIRYELLVVFLMHFNTKREYILADLRATRLVSTISLASTTVMLAAPTMIY